MWNGGGDAAERPSNGAAASARWTGRHEPGHQHEKGGDMSHGERDREEQELTPPAHDAGHSAMEAGRTRRASLAHMRHELRAPVNAILDYSHLLLEQSASLGLGALSAEL